jgi:diguanylate cyclase (GGDEF)-like protein
MDGTVGTIRGVVRLRGERRLAGLLRLAPELAVIAVCLAVIWAAVTFSIWQAREAAIESARRQTFALAQAFAESTERISTVLDRELLSLRAAYAEQGGAFNLMAWLRDQSSPDCLTIEIGMTDRSGQVVQDTLPLGGSPVSIADREHFRVHLDPEGDSLFISKPVIGRVSRRCSLQYSRKLQDFNGHFAGVAVNSASCDDLSRFYETADIGDEFIMVAGLDGVIRAYGPRHPELMGMDFSRDPGLASVWSSATGSLDGPMPWDKAAQITSFRRLDQYPLMVLVGYDDERVYRQYWSMRGRAVEIGAVATLFIVCLGGVWIQQRRRSAASREALLLTLNNMGQGIVMIDAEGRIPVINRRAVELLGLPASLLDSKRQTERAEAKRLDLMIPAEAVGSGMIDHGVAHKNGQIIEIVSQIMEGGGQVRTFTDVTDRRIAEARIRHMAHHDALTGLANRTLLSDRLSNLLQRPEPGAFGLICLDLDGFKTVNDTLGHDAGDMLLRDLSRRLDGLVSDKALLARTGGDEFAILCSDGAQPEATEAIARAIVTIMSDPFELNGARFRLSAGLGLAFHPDDGVSSVELLRHADMAMYQAKAQGRGEIVRFDAEMDRSLHERSLIERDLRGALAAGEIDVWYQPRFETQRMQVTGFEALARWRHPEHGYISPARFIPVAEQCGLISELGLHVLRQACAFAADLPEGRVAVNLSPVQFLSINLAATIRSILAETGLMPDRLELEVTEGVLIADETAALTALRSLHDCGLQIALDDFGTGYASLSYLRRFPFDRIKIDQSFVRAQEHDAATRAIVETILTMARRLGLEVTAEGMETERQLNLLLSQGCPEVQGFLLGRPMPAAEAKAFHASHRAARRDWHLAA